MDLINALTDGTVEYRDNGEVIRHPPTSIMLHAARAIKQLTEQHETNMVSINSLQRLNQSLLQDLENLRNEYDKLDSTRSVSTVIPESVCESIAGRQENGETSNVEGGGI